MTPPHPDTHLADIMAKEAALIRVRYAAETERQRQGGKEPKRNQDNGDEK